MIEVSGLCKSFKKDIGIERIEVLKSASFTLKPGAITGLLGKNGVGKTTLVKCILGFIRPDSGRILFHNQLGQGREVFRNIGFVPERPYLYENLTINEFLSFCGELHGVVKSDLSKSIREWAGKLQIKPYLNRKIRHLSKGLLQKVGLASSLIHRPKLLIWDEPLSGLDPIGRKIVKEIMRELQLDGTSILFSSHILSEVQQVAEQLVILQKGKIIFSGPQESLLGQVGEERFEIIYNDRENSEIKKVTLGKIELGQIWRRFEKGEIDLINLESSNRSLEEIFYRIDNAK